MRLPVDGPSARIAGLAAALIFTTSLGACASGDAPSFSERFASPPANGPQADYPVVVGDPYAVAGKEYVPEDVLNYDEVGYIAADSASSTAVSGSHHTLPLPSYVEVTSLETGRTALVRLERRGPMTGHELVALSPGALAQLEIAPGAPVRVRRVDPPAGPRALLPAGQQAPLRMDTPMPLVEVLRRKLPEAAAAPVQTAVVAAHSAPVEPVPQPQEQAEPRLLPQVDPSSAPVAVSRTSAVERGFVVQ